MQGQTCAQEGKTNSLLKVSQTATSSMRSAAPCWPSSFESLDQVGEETVCLTPLLTDPVFV
ncbi:MAG: hypothetical protein JRH13_07100 [Deltaproteobacteria bacterium]|nr:hypothetical protein [Deltaproteobacteria bacterium]MBW2017330.1 hypothetical protein [Deltaproteobacteria bacterium]MBW2129115.1 hypothetical protein [Deltaproteobacteria bacterium]